MANKDYGYSDYVEVNYSAVGKVIDVDAFKKAISSADFYMETGITGMQQEVVIGTMFDNEIDSKSEVVIAGFIGLNANWLRDIIDADLDKKGEDFLFNTVLAVIYTYKADIANAIAKVANNSISVDSIKNSLKVDKQYVRDGGTENRYLND